MIFGLSGLYEKAIICTHAGVIRKAHFKIVIFHAPRGDGADTPVFIKIFLKRAGDFRLLTLLIKL